MVMTISLKSVKVNFSIVLPPWKECVTMVSCANVTDVKIMQQDW